MSDILYERTQSTGPVIRVRRVSPEGETPVKAVLEADRRGGLLRDGQKPGNPPPLMETEGVSDSDVLSKLIPFAMEDAEMARLMRDKGLR
jgi:hypothetical protein